MPRSHPLSRSPLLAVLALAGTLAGPVAGQAYDPPETRASPVPAGAVIVLDGSLDEEAWRDAPVADGFRQREPETGAAAANTTDVRVLYDDRTLYIGVWARQPGIPVIGRVLQRDRILAAGFDGRPAFGGDDAVVVLLDPFHDHRNAFVFATNPNGAEFDALLTDEGREFNIDWRGVWEVRAARTADGWTAEFAIPFRTLRYPEDAAGEPWGLNVARIVRGSNEESYWSSWLRENEGMARISRAGHLTGLERLPRAGLNLEVKPYGLAGATQESTGAGAPGGPDAPGASALRSDAELDAGLDAKWEVRPGLTLDLTLNTDFAQVEADQEQVNLTRFSLFFPEKRDFFLENAGVFDLGFRGYFEPPPFLLFFSRQIGIHEEGEVPVLGGARLTGRVGGQTVGFMNVVTDGAFGDPRTNFAVARAKRDIGGSGYVGAMLTDRRNAGHWNTAGGVDASFWAGPVNVLGFYARTATAGAGGDDQAWHLGLDYTGDRFGFGFNNIGVGPEARAEAGFITRTDVIRTDLFGRVTTRPTFLGLRRVDVFFGGNLFTDMGGRLEDVYVGPLLVNEWDSGESVTFFANPGFTRIPESFALGDVDVPAGEWDVLNLGWFASTSPARPVVLGSIASWQSIYDGTIGSYGVTLTVAPDPHVTATAGYTRNRVDLPDGAFDADLASLRLDLALSTRAFLSTLLQYNQLDDQLSTNIRLNLIHAPGSDIYLVLNERRGAAGDLRNVADRGLALKVTWLRRL